MDRHYSRGQRAKGLGGTSDFRLPDHDCIGADHCSRAVTIARERGRYGQHLLRMAALSIRRTIAG